MVGHEFVRLQIAEGGRGMHAYQLTPSGNGARVASSKGGNLEKAAKELRDSLGKEGWRPFPDSVRYFSRPLREGGPQQEYEYCNAEFATDGPRITHWMAQQLTPDGLVFIDKVEEDSVRMPDVMRARLVSDGWEPIEADTILKRRIGAQVSAGEPATNASTDPMETLKKLGELRDSGVLTNEEFEGKKKDILAKM